MSLINQMRMYLRFALGLKSFLSEPLGVEVSRQIIRKRLEDREKNLLSFVKKAIYDNERSPYLQLLSLAGCEYGDFELMVRSDGVEGTLEKLCKEGVYIDLEEFKGKKEISRAGRVFKFEERDFDNPFRLGHLETRSGASRSQGTRTVFDLDHIALVWAVYQFVLFDAYDALAHPVVMWGPISPGFGPLRLLIFAKTGKTPWKWFSPVTKRAVKPSLKNRMVTNYIVYAGRFWGSKFPVPEYTAIDEAWRVAEWINRAISESGGCWVHTYTSNAVSISQAARDKGLDIAGTTFSVGGEPITEAKRREIESTGGRVCTTYVSIECGSIGFGCLHAASADDVHFCKDSLALIQHPREVPHSGLSVDAFLVTSLLLSAPKVLFNVENGDYGVVERRSCGCYFDNIGYNDHIYNIRSFDKVTGAGMTLAGTDLVRIMEELLPSRFGGASTDYQMVEEEDERGHTHLSILVSPEVGNIDENELSQTVLAELRKGIDGQRLAAEVWSQTKMLRVKRMPPFRTARGKLLPLHIQRAGNNN